MARYDEKTKTWFGEVQVNKDTFWTGKGQATKEKAEEWEKKAKKAVGLVDESNG